MGAGVRGLLVALEGPDGVGKSTQARRLEAWLRHHGARPLLVREPGGTPLGEAIRDLLLGSSVPITPLAETLLFAAARAQLVASVVRPALEGGRAVVLDRYWLSSLAYQGYGGGVPLAAVYDVNEVATGGLRPDVTILLWGRGHPRPLPPDRVESRPQGFHDRVRAGYQQLALEVPGIQVVSADDTEDAVHRAIVGIIQPLLESGEAPR
jgi:dTMP kinase